MTDFKLFRKRNKLTQIQAAEYFGCTQAFISLIERGESKLPKEYISKIKADPNFDSSMLNEEFQQNNNDEKLIENKETDINTIHELIAAIKRRDEQVDALIRVNEKHADNFAELLKQMKKKNARQEGYAGCADVVGGEITK